jgi:hypothetical protein
MKQSKKGNQMKEKPRLTPLEPHEIKASGTYYGIYDPAARLWMGDDKGPCVYDNELAAKLAATILTARFGYLIQPRKYDTAPKKQRDTVEPAISAPEAIKHIENGGI